MLKQRARSWLVKLPISVGLGLILLFLALFILGRGQLPRVLAVGPTVITGNVSITSTWFFTASPYIVQTGTVFIDSGAALTIEPGVTVQFEEDARMEIDNGQLIAIGTDSQPITFTTLNTQSRGIWAGIQFNATTVSTIENAIVEYAREGIRMDASNPAVFHILSNTIRYAGDNDGNPATGGAIIGTPDDSFINYNTIYNSEVGIRFNEVGNNGVQNNAIYDIDEDCIAIVPGGASSNDNQITGNQIYNCGASGININDNGTGTRNNIINNVISNTISHTVYLRNQRELTITGNVIFDIRGNNVSGTVFDDFHSDVTLHSNVICVADRYEIEDRDLGLLLTAAGNWLGTNLPQVGAEIIGTVDFTPSIALSATSNPSAIPADGVSTSIITITMNDGNGHTVPSFARDVNLATSLGALSPSSVTLDANGVATTTLTAPTTFGTATITATEPCNFPVTTTVQFQATDLEISKTSGITTVTAGDLITYTIAYTNNSAVTALDVTITETLPLSATYFSDSSTPNLTRGPTGGNVITWNIPSLANGSDGFITLTLRVDPNAPCGSSATTLTNRVDIGSATAESSPASNLFFDTVIVSCQTVSGTLSITKTANVSAITPGRDIVYTIAYANNTPFTITNVTITDTLPLSTTFITSTAIANGFSEIAGTGAITWNRPFLTPLESGSFTMTVRVNSQPICSPFNATNTAGINAQFVSGASVIAGVSVNVLCGVDLIVTKNDDIGLGSSDVSPVVEGGNTFTYTISIVNLGNDPASNVVISETIPVSTTFVGPTGPNGWFPAGGRVYTYLVGSLASNGGRVITLELRADFGLSLVTTTVTNEVCVSSAQPDTIPGNNCDSVDTDLIGLDNQVIISKNDGNLICAIPGQEIIYTIAVTNVGSVPATNLALNETLPANTSFQGPLDGTWTMAGPTAYTHTIGTLNGGVTDQTPFWVQVDPNTPPSVNTITNVVTLTPQNLTFVLTTPIVHNAPDLYVVKNDDIELLPRATLETMNRIERKLGYSPPWFDKMKRQARTQATFVLPGAVISYSVAYGNAGTITATNVVITETLPANTQFLGPASWTQVNTNTYIFTRTNLSSGQGGILNFRVRVNDPFPANTIGVTNTVQIGSDFLLECDASDNISIEFTPVRPIAFKVYLPLVLKDFPLPPNTPTPTSTPVGPPPTATPTPMPLAWVSDVAADPTTNQVFIASPRQNAVQVVDGAADAYVQPVPVGHGPSGLAVLTSTTPSKVFVVHEPDWTPGLWFIDANSLNSHSMADQGGYVGARPVKVTVNSLTNRAYVSNYWDRMPLINALSENRIAWVFKKNFQASFGLEASQATNLIYMASVDTGELIIFDAAQAEADPNNYGACHNAPPDDDSNGDADPRNLRMVAVNPSTGHVFVTSPPDHNTGQTDSRVYVLDEAILLGPQGTNGQPPSDSTCTWNFLPKGTSPNALPGKGWIKTIALPGASLAGAGHVGITVNPANNKVYVTDGDGNQVFVIQDGDAGSLNLPLQVISSGFDNPQGVDVNLLTGKVYVANARNPAAPYGTVTVLNEDNTLNKIIPLTSPP